MKRSTLDDLARDHRLDARAIAVALDLSGARPDRAAWRAFAARLLNAAGAAAAGAGAIFFVAANWQHFGVLGRFAMLELALLVCVALAWWRPPPDMLGRTALAVATLFTGGLLALFGQSYQTGADVYELFVAWAALALPFALAGRSGAVWAIWWGVLNVAMALFCGWLGPAHFMWQWLDQRGVGKPAMLMLPCAVNLAGAAAFAYAARTRFAEHAPRAIVRMLMAFAFLYGTAASVLAVSAGGGGREAPGMSGQDALVVAAFAAVSIAAAMAALRTKRDVFPIALIIASWIAITSAALIRHLPFQDIGAILVMALWLIGTSTAAGFVLMNLVRTWRIDEDDEAVPEATA